MSVRWLCANTWKTLIYVRSFGFFLLTQAFHDQIDFLGDIVLYLLWVCVALLNFVVEFL